MDHSQDSEFKETNALHFPGDSEGYIIHIHRWGNRFRRVTYFTQVFKRLPNINPFLFPVNNNNSGLSSKCALASLERSLSFPQFRSQNNSNDPNRHSPHSHVFSCGEHGAVTKAGHLQEFQAFPGQAIPGEAQGVAFFSGATGRPSKPAGGPQASRQVKAALLLGPQPR